MNKVAAFEIRPTSENGKYYIWNNVSNEYVSISGNNVYCNSTATQFELVETSKPSITISRSGNWGTIILPFDAAIPEGLTAYSCTGVDDNDKLTLESVDAFKANTPYIIKGTCDATLTGDAQGTQLSYTSGLLTGVYTAATIPASSGNTTNYVLQTQADGQAFYKVDTDFTATPYKCYLTVTSSEVKAFFLDFGGEDAINGIEAETENAEIFNLAGQRVNKAQRGIYIVNGKKVLVK